MLAKMRSTRAHAKKQTWIEISDFFINEKVPEEFDSSYLESAVEQCYEWKRYVEQDIGEEFADDPKALKNSDPENEADGAEEDAQSRKSSYNSSDGEEANPSTEDKVSKEVENVYKYLEGNHKLWVLSGLEQKSTHSTKAQKFQMILPEGEGLRLLTVGRDFKLPWNIYCPTVCDERTLVHWEHSLKRNEWKAPYNHKSPTELKCECLESRCDRYCNNRLMQIECTPSNCASGENDCGNRQFSNLLDDLCSRSKFATGYEVVETKLKGRGLVATRSYNVGTLVIEYTGEVIDLLEVEHRLDTIYKDQTNFYFLGLEDDLIIDAGQRGSVARFVNHSCDPNCEIQKWYVDNEPRIGLFVTRPISPGEEICYDYNFEFFEDSKPQTCYCGSALCRGIIAKQSANTLEEEKPMTNGKAKISREELVRELSVGEDDHPEVEQLEDDGTGADITLLAPIIESIKSLGPKSREISRNNTPQPIDIATKPSNTASQSPISPKRPALEPVFRKLRHTAAYFEEDDNALKAMPEHLKRKLVIEMVEPGDQKDTRSVPQKRPARSDSNKTSLKTEVEPEPEPEPEPEVIIFEKPKLVEDIVEKKEQHSKKRRKRIIFSDSDDEIDQVHHFEPLKTKSAPTKRSTASDNSLLPMESNGYPKEPLARSTRKPKPSEQKSKYGAAGRQYSARRQKYAEISSFEKPNPTTFSDLGDLGSLADIKKSKRSKLGQTQPASPPQQEKAQHENTHGDVGHGNNDNFKELVAVPKDDLNGYGKHQGPGYEYTKQYYSHSPLPESHHYGDYYNNYNRQDKYGPQHYPDNRYPPRNEDPTSNDTETGVPEQDYAQDGNGYYYPPPPQPQYPYYYQYPYQYYYGPHPPPQPQPDGEQRATNSQVTPDEESSSANTQPEPSQAITAVSKQRATSTEQPYPAHYPPNYYAYPPPPSAWYSSFYAAYNNSFYQHPYSSGLPGPSPPDSGRSENSKHETFDGAAIADPPSSPESI